ncbi:MAG: ATP-binding protein [Opitutaceae bacterium]|jgi:two-component system sensor histidine kinase KdpD
MPPARPDLDLPPAAPSRWKEYVSSVVVILVVTAASSLLPESYYLSVGLIYLLAIILLCLRVGRGPVLLAGVLGAFAWEFIFIPPHFSFAINSLQDSLLFGTYFVVSLVAGQLTAQIRSQAQNDRLRERRATALLHLTRALAGAKTLDEAIFAALRQTDGLFNAQTSLALTDETRQTLLPHPAGSYSPEAAEWATAEWAFRHQRQAGRFTGTQPECAGYYLPLVRGPEAIGVLGVKVPPDGTLSRSQRDLVEAFAQQLALTVEREHLRAASEREKLLAQSDKLHRTLLDSVSHELRTPLAVINASTESLAEADHNLQRQLVNEIRTAVRRLNRLVGNLLDQTRLESGTLKPRLDWCDAGDIVNAAIESTRDALAGHPLTITVPEGLPPMRADFALTEHILANLLLNAANHTPAATPVFLSAGVEPGGRRVFFTVADRGPGFPPAQRERLFKKFVREDAAGTTGLGLGLSIVRGFVIAQGGEVVAGENSGGGAVITVYLPHPRLKAPTQA